MIRVRVLGEQSLARKLAAIGPALDAAMKREVKVAAVNIQNGARRRVPVKTGRLRNSITHEIAEDGLNAAIGSNAQYAPYVEFGTRRMRARPYLFPAFEEERPQYMARLRRALQKTAEGFAVR